MDRRDCYYKGSSPATPGPEKTAFFLIKKTNMEAALKLCNLAVTGTLCLLEKVLVAGESDDCESSRPTKSSRPNRRRRRLIKFEVRSKKGYVVARRSSSPPPPRQRSVVSRVPGLRTIIEEGNKQEGLGGTARLGQRPRQKAPRSRA